MIYSVTDEVVFDPENRVFPTLSEATQLPLLHEERQYFSRAHSSKIALYDDVGACSGRAAFSAV